MAHTPKSQWSWEFSEERGKGDMQFLIVDYKRRTALLRREEGHWVLPGVLTHSLPSRVMEFFEVLQEHVHESACLWPAHTVWITREKRMVKRRAGGKLRTAVLEISKSVLLVECCEEEPPAVDGYDWESLEDKQVYHLFEKAASCIKEEVENVLNGAYPEKRMAWERPGWLQGAISLLENKVNSKVIMPISIFRSSIRSALFKARTSKGSFYFKTSPAAANDAAMSEAMARIVPEYCAMPVFVDKEKRIMITREYGEPVRVYREILTEGLNSVAWEDVNNVLGLVQRATIGKAEDLIEAGFIDGREESLLEIFDEVVNHPELLWLETMFKADPVKHKTFIKHLTVLRKETAKIKKGMEIVLEEVKKFEIPHTVIHNDIITNNVIRDAETGSLKVIDWERGCVGHPFMDQCFSTESSYWDLWKENVTQVEMVKIKKMLSPHGHLLLLFKTLNTMAEVEGYIKHELAVSARIDIHFVVSAVEYVEYAD